MLQAASQRFMATTPDMKINATEDKPVVVVIRFHLQKNYKIFSIFRFDNERDNKPHYEKYAVDMNEYNMLMCCEEQLWNHGVGCSFQDQERAGPDLCLPKVRNIAY